MANAETRSSEGVKCLTDDEANLPLRAAGFEIGAWGQIKGIVRQDGAKEQWIKYRAPSDASNLFCFSQHALGWIDVGKWKLFQMDNSTNLSYELKIIFENILVRNSESINFLTTRSFMFENIGEMREEFALNIRMALCIHLIMLFKHHAEVVSESNYSTHSGKILSIQDGYVYFISTDTSDLEQAKNMLSEVEKHPTTPPGRVLNIRDK